MTHDALLDTVLQGLAQPQKTLPPTLFYDEVGSALFEQITTLDEYYPTRVETALLARRGPDLARAAARGADRVVLIEPGCGSADKVAALLPHLPAIAYVGVDVSAAALHAGAERLAQRFPNLPICSVEADYHGSVDLPDLPEGRRVAFFPGSTIGNFDPDEAVRFLANLTALVGPEGTLVVGVDLWKDPAVLHAAYDDRAGVTAAFDLNALVHLNRRYEADFEVERFEHVARVNVALRRVEMHLVARVAHTFQVAGRGFHIDAGESIHTENAYKYDLDAFASLAARAGLGVLGAWTDDEGRFAEVVLGG